MTIRESACESGSAPGDGGCENCQDGGDEHDEHDHGGLYVIAATMPLTTVAMCMMFVKVISPCCLVMT